MHLTVRRRVYQVTATAVALPGEEERLYSLAFVPTPALAGVDRGVTLPGGTIKATDLDATTLTAMRGPP
jgi:hypothetical protein